MTFTLEEAAWVLLGCFVVSLLWSLWKATE